jgi:hypothetical protein
MRRLFGRLRQAPYNSAPGVLLAWDPPKNPLRQDPHTSSGQLLGMLAGGGLATGQLDRPV